MLRAFVRLTLVIVVVLLLQLSLISEMHLLTATGDILLLLAISAGIAAGPEWGALTGFIAGIAFDLVLQTPFGLSALSYCIVGYLVGRVQTGILRAAWWVPMVTAAIASAAGVVLFAVLEALLGDAPTTRAIPTHDLSDASVGRATIQFLGIGLAIVWLRHFCRLIRSYR